MCFSLTPQAFRKRTTPSPRVFDSWFLISLKLLPLMENLTLAPSKFLLGSSSNLSEIRTRRSIALPLSGKRRETRRGKITPFVSALGRGAFDGISQKTSKNGNLKSFLVSLQLCMLLIQESSRCLSIWCVLNLLSFFDLVERREFWKVESFFLFGMSMIEIFELSWLDSLN